VAYDNTKIQKYEINAEMKISGVGGGVYVLTSHCNFKTCVNVPHMKKTVTDLGGTDIPPVAMPLIKISGYSLIEQFKTI